MKLAPIDAAAYARDVLPLTAELWAGRRDYETYVTQTNEIAACGYGQRHYRTLGLYDGAQLVASLKRYERTVHFGTQRLQAVGIGAVFTPNEFRGRGYASALLAMVLDRSRADGYDLAYLFSDIRPQFYNELGFTTLPSRSMSLRADGLAGSRIEVQRLDEGDWTGVRRCFELGERLRPWGFARTPLVWDWIRMRYRHDSEHAIGVQTNLVVRRGRGIAAYILGVRDPEHDAYLVDEYGFADAEAGILVGPLLRAAAGDLRRVAGWLPPDPAREALARASVRKRTNAIFMAAPLTRGGTAWLEVATAKSKADGVWSTDHI
ncbi:MAG TPA: GNAT family N-acetyltransferase [Candidatus Baltobacteraceae bacterium]|nr:GNAT family N-acetyltransferase [Candidatus Baltobacteraceae bacterium]